MKKPELRIFEGPEKLLHALADQLIAMANSGIAEKGVFTLVLSGGNSPNRLYEVLSSPAYCKRVDWTKVYFFFGDERYVPKDNPENNAFMANKFLFEPLQIPKDHVISIDTSLTPEKAATAYARELQLFFKQAPIRFDCILLGLGEDAHTASLFPYSPVVMEQKATVRSLFVETVDMYRITLTAPLINQAKEVIFLVYGANKALAVRQVLAAIRDVEKYPAQLIHPTPGNLYWYLDRAASSVDINGF